ncbi:hypothetical protein PO909_031448 [Leuciscus waleckii]
MNSSMAMTALISASHEMTCSVTLTVTALEIEFACLNGKANIVQNLSAHPAVVGHMVFVWPLVSAIASLGGWALAVMSVNPIQGACMAPANIPGSAGVTWDGMARCVTRVKMLGCSDGTGLTETFSTDQSSISTSAPITVPFDLKWLGTVSVIIEAWNTDSSNDHSKENLNSMISYFATQRNLTIGEKWSQDVHLGEQSKLRFSYRVVCNEFFYGDDCSDICLPRDDPFGHFNCDAAGNRICLPEWKGKYCAEPICSSGCGGTHGICVAPGQCHCFSGWLGPRCDECKPDPGCMHGTCTYPRQCRCDLGWHGTLCDKGQNV